MEHGDYANQGLGSPQPLTGFPVAIEVAMALL